MEIKIGNSSTQLDQHATVNDALYAFVNLMRVEGYIPNIEDMMHQLDTMVEADEGPFMSAYAEGFKDCIFQLGLDLEEQGLKLVPDASDATKYKVVTLDGTCVVHLPTTKE